MISSEPREMLKMIVEEYGRSVGIDSKRIEGLLKDYCGEYQREIFLLVQAAKSGIPEKLLQNPDMMIANLVRALVDQYFIAEEAARWAVESWAYALLDKSFPDIESGVSSMNRSFNNQNNNYFFNKQTVYKDTKQVATKRTTTFLERIFRGGTPADRVTLSIEKELVNDKEFQFLCTQYGERVGLKGLRRSVFATPVVDPKSLIITKWYFLIDHEPFLEFNSINDLQDHMVEVILMKGPDLKDAIKAVEEHLKTTK